MIRQCAHLIYLVALISWNKNCKCLKSNVEIYKQLGGPFSEVVFFILFQI